MAITLIEPCEGYLPSYIAARDECLRAGNADCYFDDARRFHVLRKFEKLRKAEGLYPGQVGADYYWLVDDERARFIGEISIRHSLTPSLQRIGGHVGYAVRPSEQGKGYAARMLRLALPHARARGIRHLLVTCEDGNAASIRVLEKSGFTLLGRTAIGKDGPLVRRYQKDLLEGDDPMRNVVLIGMPGCGKSTVGVVLAKTLAMDFVDSDLVIQQKMNAKLSELLDEYGDDGFREIEDRINAELDVQGSVIATGGSVVYGEKAMRHLKEIGAIIYLKLSYEAIEDRLGDLHARGVTIKPGWTLRDLYNERCPLYEQWADITVDCEALRLREVVAYLQRRLT